MALTPTTTIALGFQAPGFNLPDTVSGQTLSFEDIKGEKGTLVMFICNHCPFVVHIRKGLVQLARDYITRGIGVVAISSNDVLNYPDDRPEKMRELAVECAFPFPYLYDESQKVARAYDAACTPDFSVFDAQEKCVYRGRMDASGPGNNIPVNGKDLRTVFDALLTGKPVPEQQTPSIGCSIKWK